MGWGDEVMVTGEAKRLGKKVRVLDRHGRPRWHPLWERNPLIAHREESGFDITNGPGARPYIDYRKTTDQRWRYTSWRCTPGELRWVSPRQHGDSILIEPNIKAKASPNKQWGWDNWQELARVGLPLVQVGPPQQRWLDGVERIVTRTFIEGANVLAGCRAAILPEGGLHHVAAAVGTPAVVLFGGMTSPRNTGYDSQESLAVDSPDALGWRIKHPACDEAWKSITPEDVCTALTRILMHN